MSSTAFAVPTAISSAQIARIEVLTARLPFRFSFGHALATRHDSTNLYVRLTLDDGTVGYGEGVPREYVTGETAESAVAALCNRFAPALLGQELRDPDTVPDVLDHVATITGAAEAVGGVTQGAAWCALELALLDAAGKRFGCSVQRWLGGSPAPTVRYDAVLPLTGPRTLAVLAVLIRLIGFRQVKVKVGDDLANDLRTLRLLRRRLGSAIDLRVDANCAWSADEALIAIAQMRPYRLSAIEQPISATDLAGLRQITAATSELIVVDESLRTVAEAHTLADQDACNAFNIRVSKCGGLLNSARIARIAREADLTCVVGAQVGESGILSAAGRHLAAAIKPRYVEGSAGRLLLKEDLTIENVLPGRGGLARTFTGPGLGVTVNEETLRCHGRAHGIFDATSAPRA